MSEDLVGMAAVGAVMVAIVVGMGLLGYWASSVECREKAQMMQMPHDYSFMAGCMVQTKNGWRPLNALREIDQ